MKSIDPPRLRGATTPPKEGTILVAQFAPSVRVTIGEDFKMPYGKDTAGKITAGLRKLGFDYVFDINFGADLTTIVEANELLERVVNKKSKMHFDRTIKTMEKQI